MFSKEKMPETLVMIEKDTGMAGMWEQFKKRNYFVGDLEWKDALDGVLDVIYINNLWGKRKIYWLGKNNTGTGAANKLIRNT